MHNWNKRAVAGALLTALCLALLPVRPSNAYGDDLTSNEPYVQYDFESNLTDSKSHSVLTPFGTSNDGFNRNNLETSFGTDDTGTYWQWRSSLARGGGFIVNIDRPISDEYTIGLQFSFTNCTSGYRKIIDYQNSATDSGFYFLNGNLNFYPIGTGSIKTANNQVANLIVTRTADPDNQFTVYFVNDGVVDKDHPALSVKDVSGLSKPVTVNGGTRLGFFFDDKATGGEATPGGKVYNIKIWDKAIDPDDVLEALKNGKVIVSCVDESGDPIAGDNELMGKPGDPYEVDPLDFFGYEFIGVTEGSLTGVYPAGGSEIHVTLQYRNVKPYTVAARYVDEDGNKLCPDIVSKGLPGTSYTTYQLQISGYEFVKVDGNPNGSYIEAPQTVVYTYKRIEELPPVPASDVMVRYVAEDGTVLAPSMILKGELDAPFQTQKKDIDGYTCVRAEGSESGTFTTDVQVVTYVYKLTVEVSLAAPDIDYTGLPVAYNPSIAPDTYPGTFKTAYFKKSDGAPDGGAGEGWKRMDTAPVNAGDYRATIVPDKELGDSDKDRWADPVFSYNGDDTAAYAEFTIKKIDVTFDRADVDGVVAGKIEYTGNPVSAVSGWDHAVDAHWGGAADDALHLTDGAYTLEWQDADGNKLDEAPSAPGAYRLHVHVGEGANWNEGDKTVDFTIEQTAAAEITLDPISQVTDRGVTVYGKIYDANPLDNPGYKVVSGIFKGTVDFEWFADEACTDKLAAVPTEPGAYYVKATVVPGEGEKYPTASSDDAGWKRVSASASRMSRLAAVLPRYERDFPGEVWTHEASIVKAELEVNPEEKTGANSLIYTGAPAAYTLDYVTWERTDGKTAGLPTKDDAEVAIEWFSDAACTDKLTAAPTELGTYYVKATIAESDYCHDGIGTARVDVVKGDDYFWLRYDSAYDAPPAASLQKVNESIGLDGGGSMRRPDAGSMKYLFAGWSLNAGDRDAIIPRDGDAALEAALVSAVTARDPDDLTVHAVWAEDANDDGTADYLQTFRTLEYISNDTTGAMPASVTDLDGTAVSLDGGDSMTHADDNGVPVVFLGWTHDASKLDLITDDEADLNSLVTQHTLGRDGDKVYAVWSHDANHNGTPDARETFRDVTHRFASGTPGRELPAALMPTLPADYAAVVDSTVSAPITAYGDVPDGDGGTWTFTGWGPATAVVVDEVPGATFTGIWTWSENARHNVNYEFVSGTDGRELPQGVLDQLPASATEPEGRSVSAPTSGFTAVGPDDGGTWTFVAWDPASQVMGTEDLTFTGAWVWTANEYRDVAYRFVSGTEGRELPESIDPGLLPEPTTAPVGLEVVAPALGTTSVPDGTGGTWTFDHWDPVSQPMDEDGIEFVGTWVWSENPRRDITCAFVSGTEGRELPESIDPGLLPEPATAPEDAMVSAPGLRATSIADGNGGTWTFDHWDPVSQVMDEDGVEFEGTWIWTENPRHDVTYEFVSGTDGRELPQGVLDQLPETTTAPEDGAIELPEEFYSVIVEGGRWVFKGWAETGRMGKEDMTVQGTWTFVPDLVEDEEPEGKKPTVGGVLPKMGDDLSPIIVMLAFAGAAMLTAERLRRMKSTH